MKHTKPELWLIRHGETEWSLSGAHTSHTDIPLTQRGCEQALNIRRILQSQHFSRVLTSPMTRARETCRIAGFDHVAQIRTELTEWDYGQYEGRTTQEIRVENPDWSVWNDNLPGGETLAAVGERAEKIIEECVLSGGRILLFSHAHFLRIFAAVWVGLAPKAGRLLALHTGSVSILGYERESRVVVVWNQSLDSLHPGDPHFVSPPPCGTRE